MHTTGPWSIHPYSDKEYLVVQGEDGGVWAAKRIIIGSGDKIVASVELRSGGDAPYPHISNYVELAHTVDLIVQAPAMHDQLQEIRDYLDSICVGDDWGEAIKALKRLAGV